MKTLTFLGTSLDAIRSFPSQAKRQAGYELHQVQIGNMPTDFKIMPTIGSGVIEIRIKEKSGIFRVIYTAKFQDTVYVLHAFQKKSQKTAPADLNLAIQRYKELTNR